VASAAGAAACVATTSILSSISCEVLSSTIGLPGSPQGTTL
jgi:hypothetical protein